MKRLWLAALLILPFQANALLISSSVGDFEVTTVDVRGKDAVLQTTAWWGSADLAKEFAGLVNNDLGLDWFLVAGTGPLFAYKNYDDDTFYAVYVSTLLGSFVTRSITDEDDVHTYAVSRRVGATTTVPEPASLALLGVGLFALGLRRRFARG